jgi:hypothetical protein
MSAQFTESVGEMSKESTNKAMQQFQNELEQGLQDFINNPDQLRSMAEVCKNLGFNFAGDDDFTIDLPTDTDLESLMVPDEDMTIYPIENVKIDPMNKLLNGQENIIRKLDNISRKIEKKPITLDTIFETQPVAIGVLSVTSVYALYCIYKWIRR